jgi:hypothetical protein
MRATAHATPRPFRKMSNCFSWCNGRRVQLYTGRLAPGIPYPTRWLFGMSMCACHMPGRSDVWASAQGHSHSQQC